MTPEPRADQGTAWRPAYQPGPFAAFDLCGGRPWSIPQMSQVERAQVKIRSEKVRLIWSVAQTMTEAATHLQRLIQQAASQHVQFMILAGGPASSKEPTMTAKRLTSPLCLVPLITGCGHFDL
jgi:hypothetical protein